MKSVMISIQPKWCELIASGEKTVEVRKSKPNIAIPFKCYIYQTKGKCMFNILRKIGLYDMANKLLSSKGKVIGEFICNNIDWHGLSNLIIKEDAEHTLSGTCLTKEEILNYLGYQKGTNIYACKNFDFYGWRISDLVIYDRAKEINEFYHKKTKNGYTTEWNIEGIVHYPKKEVVFEEIKRPPQSWCYVDE